jgi:phosphate transport system substrate-binding protein
MFYGVRNVSRVKEAIYMKNVKRLIALILLAAVCFATTALAEEITIVGTGSGTAILKAIGEAFSQQNPEITINIPPSIGSGGGIKAVGRDEYLLGRVARDIKEKEKPYGLTYVPYAKIPIVFFTNKSVTLENLSPQQVTDIYNGKTTNWKEVGGNDAKIRVVTREEGDSSLEVLLKLFPGFQDITITSKAKTTFSDPETEATVLKTTNVIAYGSYPNAKVIDVKVLTIDGKSPADPDYPYVGPLGFVYKEENYSGNIKKFVEFATSEAAHEVIAEAGGIPF